MMAAMNEDDLFAVIIKGSIGFLAILTIAAFVFFSSKMALGVLAGGLIAVINFCWMRSALQRILCLLPAHPARHALFRYIGRISATGFALYFVLTSGLFPLAGVLTGLSIIVVNIIILSLYRAISGTGG